MPSRRTQAATTTLLAAALAARAASAEVSLRDHIALDRGPDARQCFDRDALAERVQARLWRASATTADVAGISVYATVHRDGASPGWRATLTVVDDRRSAVATRVITSDRESCAAVEDALVIAIALALGLDSRPEAADASRPENAAAALPAERPARWTLIVAAGGGVEVGLLPHAQTGPWATARVGPSRGPVVEIGAAHFPSTSVGSALGGATFRLSAFGAAACLPIVRADLGLALCGGAQATATAFQSFGFAHNRAETQWNIQARLGAIVEQSLYGGLHAVGGLDFLVPVRRSSYDYLDSTGTSVRLFRPPAAALELRLGLGYRFR
jgi:hypothetical protein